MSYVCGVCGGVVEAGVKRKVHRTYRKVPHTDDRGRACHRSEIVRETPVCGDCDSALWAGQTLEERGRYFKEPVKVLYSDLRAKGERIGPVVCTSSPRKMMEALGKLTEAVVTQAKEKQEEDHRPRCDVCGEVVVDGQVTAESTLCSKHLKSILQRKRRTK